MDFWTSDRIKKFSVITAHLILIYWILYVVFHTNHIQAPFIILNYIGMGAAGILLNRLGTANA